MSKYEPLTRFLQHQPGGEVRLSFAQIEQLVGFKLPDTAQHEPDWWSNALSDDAEAQAWLAAGFRSEEVNIAAGELMAARGAVKAALWAFGRKPGLYSMRDVLGLA